MSAFEIKSGETVHCMEMNFGRKFTGAFKFDQDGIHAYICSFEKPFFIRPKDPIVLLTEKNVIVSLHSNISAPPGSGAHK